MRHSVARIGFRFVHETSGVCLRSAATGSSSDPKALVLDGGYYRVRELQPGAVVLMLNLSMHKGPHKRELIQAARARLLFLPTYGQNLDPIENAFVRLKAMRAKADARIVDAAWSVVARIVPTYIPAEQANQLAAEGYNSWKSAIALTYCFAFQTAARRVAG